jgi:hypothetical protein
MMTGLLEPAIQSLVVHNTDANTVWACTFNGAGAAVVGLWKTTNGGTNWFASSTGIASDNKNVLSIAINPLNPNVLYAGTSIFYVGTVQTGPTKIYKSYNGGVSWNLMSTGLPLLTTDINPVRCLQVLKSDTSVVGAALFVNVLTGGFFLSTDGGSNWTKKHSGLPEVVGSLLRSLSMRSANEFYVGMDGGATTKGVWRTTNGGNNWAEFNNAVMTNTHPVRLLMFKTTGDTTLYSGAAGTSVALTGVYEYTWPGAPSSPVPDLIYYRFENNTPGFTPNYAIPGVGSNPAPLTGTALSFAPGGQFDSCLSGTGGSGGHISTNWATNFGSGSWTISMWLNNIPNNETLNYLFEEATGGFRSFYGGSAGAGNVILRGTGLIDIIVTAVAPGPTVVHFVYDSATATITGYKNGVFALSVPQTPLNLATGTNFQVGGYSASNGINGQMDEFRIYRRALGQAEITATWNQELGLITGITPINIKTPTTYSLSQNYPNPFNPVTKINFAIPKSGLVTLKVYDILGREVMTLVNEMKTAGNYTVDFNGANLSSGAYFYRLKSGEFIDTKRMMLIK